MSFFRELFTDNKNKLSSMRVAWFMSITTVMVTWAIVCLVRREFINFTMGDATLVGTLFGSKALQVFGERDK